MNYSKENLEAKLQNFKTTIEDLKNQLGLNEEEIQADFENQKENLKNWIDKVVVQLKDSESIASEEAAKIKTKMEELRVQAALGKAETSDILKEQHKNLNSVFHDLKYDLKKAYESSSDSTRDLLDQAKDKLDDFSTKFDLYKLRADQAEDDAENIWYEKKKELTEKLSDLKTKLEENKDISSEKLEGFTKEMSEAWSHIQNAFKS